MNVLIVLAHPEPHSFSGAMAETAATGLTALGHQVVVSDLYRQGFDPVSDRRNFTGARDAAYYKQQVEEAFATGSRGFVPDLEREIARLEACELMIWQFPLWWFGLPAVLKGWVDRVFAFQRIYGGGRIYDNGLFRGRRALLSFTTGGPPEAYRADGRNGDIEAILRPIQRGMLQFVGFDVLRPQIVWQAARLSAADRATALADWRGRLPRLFEEAPIDVGRY